MQYLRQSFEKGYAGCRAGTLFEVGRSAAREWSIVGIDTGLREAVDGLELSEGDGVDEWEEGGEEQDLAEAGRPRGGHVCWRSSRF